MKSLVRPIFLGLVLISVSASIQAGAIVSTFGPGDSYQSCCGLGNVFPADLAYAFQTPIGSDYTFTGAALALSEGIGSTNAVDIFLAGDASGQPGAILESFHLVNFLGPAGAANPPVVVTSVINPVLTAGGVYWLIEAPTTSGNGVNWLTALIPSTDPLRASGVGNSGPWTVANVSVLGNNPGAFDIFANPVAPSVPEPGTVLLMGSGFGLAALYKRRLVKNRRVINL